jgi:hypothetical protein
MTTPNMLLSLPTVTQQPGPEWASMLNAAIESIDSHDHSSDKGVKITPSGLEINADLDISNQVFYNFKSVKFQEQVSTLSGSTYSNSIYSVNGNLYFTSGSGTAIQITDGGSIVSTPSSASIFETTSITTNLTIGNSDTFVYLIVDTSVARIITLPLASGVSAGRIYYIKDSSGLSETYNITVNTQGSDTLDGAASQTLSSNYGTWTIIGDGSASWYIS